MKFDHSTTPEYKPAEPTLADLLPGFDREKLAEACITWPVCDAVIEYLTPLVRQLVAAKDAAHSRGDEARYHMVTAINDCAEMMKQLAAERAARETAELDLKILRAAFKREKQRAEVAEAALRKAVIALATIRDRDFGSDLRTIADAALATPSAERAAAEAEVLRVGLRELSNDAAWTEELYDAFSRLRAAEVKEKGGGT